MSLPTSSPSSAGPSEAESFSWWMRSASSTPSSTQSFFAADLDAFMAGRRADSSSSSHYPAVYNTPLSHRQDDLKAELRKAKTLLTHTYNPVTGESFVIPVLWPQDMKSGKAVSLSALRKYTSSHEFLDHITCFCSLKTGVNIPVKLFKVTKAGSEHYGNLCLGCKLWEPLKEGLGCSYFVNLTRLLSGFPNQDLFYYPEYDAPMKAVQRRKQQAQERADAFPLPKDSTWTPPAKLPPMRKVPPSEDETQTVMPYIEDGGVGCIDRLMQPIPTAYVEARVCNVVPPSYDVTRDILMSLFTRGIKLEEFVRLVGICSHCKSLVALCTFPEHGCIRPLVKRRADGSWVSVPSPNRSRSLRPFPMPINSLEDVFNTTTPPRGDPRTHPFLSTDIHPVQRSPTPASSASGSSLSRAASDVFFGTPFVAPSPPPVPQRAPFVPPIPLPVPQYTIYGPRWNYGASAPAALRHIERNTARAEAALAAAEEAALAAAEEATLAAAEEVIADAGAAIAEVTAFIGGPEVLAAADPAAVFTPVPVAVAPAPAPVAFAPAPAPAPAAFAPAPATAAAAPGYPLPLTPAAYAPVPAPFIPAPVAFAPAAAMLAPAAAAAHARAPAPAATAPSAEAGPSNLDVLATAAANAPPIASTSTAVKVEQWESDGEPVVLSVDPAARSTKRKRPINVLTPPPQKKQCLGFIDLTD
ncbi:hypothetical protein EIP86_000301 [Pleurotus ostreatoroseus]|nr:hypothetical protein EIP86_000301 [Pleurotus ostreatoroseus]